MSASDSRKRLKLVRSEAAEHAAWLEGRSIQSHCHRVLEVLYTGFVTSALLSPEIETQSAILSALLSGAGKAGHAVTGRTLTMVGLPTDVLDLVLVFDEQDAVVFEHKRCSKSNAPWVGKRQLVPHFPGDLLEQQWQTDIAFFTCGGQHAWLCGVAPERVVGRVVLDAAGRTMGEMFKDGYSNAEWEVTSYGQFSSSLRSSHEKGVPGLIPLLTTLYAHEMFT